MVVLRHSQEEDKTIWQVGNREEFFDLPVLPNHTKEENEYGYCSSNIQTNKYKLIFKICGLDSAKK